MTKNEGLAAVFVLPKRWEFVALAILKEWILKMKGPWKADI